MCDDAVRSRPVVTMQPALVHPVTHHDRQPTAWSTPPRLLAIGTYFRDYPSNALLLAAARALGCSVTEVTTPVLAQLTDRLAPFHNLLSLGSLGLRVACAEARLLWRASRRLAAAHDVLFIGYPGQLDALLLGRVARASSKPLIYAPLVTLTETLVEDRAVVSPNSPRARLLRWLDRAALRAATVVIADTAEHARAMQALSGLPPSRFAIVPVGADDTLFDPERVSPAQRAAYRRQWPNADAEPLRVLFYGSFIPLHGAATIVQAIAQLSASEVSCVMIGAGQCWEQAYTLAADAAVRHLRFRPPVPANELPRWIAAADVVLGIFGDTAKAAQVVPNKVYQAMAMGAALVTRESPAVRSLLQHDRTAVLVPPADPAALAAAIRRLRDPAVRARLGAAAREAFIQQASAPVRQRLLQQALEMAYARVRGDGGR